jgi:uncharacterized RDD family membrane protein YckC
MYNEELSIQTPEQIDVSYTIADAGTRFMATAIDALLQYLPVICLSIAASGIGLGALVDPDSAPETFIGRFGPVAALLLAFLIQFGYFIVFEQLMNGQTPGKRLVGLRVVREDGRPLSFVDVLVRNMVRIVDFFPAFYSIGLIVMLCNTRAKRLGDFAAGTLVVREAKPINLASLTPSGSGGGWVNRGEGRLPGIERLTQRDIDTIDQLALRRYTIDNPAELEHRLAAALAKKMATPEAEALLGQGVGHFLNRVAAEFKNG